MIKNLIFDLDGTLFDSSEANIRAYTLAFEKVSRTFDTEKYKSNFGLRFDEMMEVVSPGLPNEVKIEIKKLKSVFYKENLDLIKCNEGLLSLVRAKAFTKALVTTASKVNVYNLLNHFSVDPKLFSVIITGEDVVSGKPDPECYLTTLQRLGASPDECCVFEDTDLGVSAASSAGLQVVRVVI